MDTSGTYIKMCEKSEEIQKLFKDAAYHRRGGSYGTLIYYYDEANKKQRLDMFIHFFEYGGRPTTEIVAMPSEYNPWQTYTGMIWQHDLSKVTFLPRQDQLQEMIGNYRTCKNALFEAGYNDNEYASYWGKSSEYWGRFESMEQLWLGFVMADKYNKTWNDEEWVSA